MRTKKIIIVFCSLIVLLGVSVSPSVVYGTQGTGGQVNTGGKISFYDEASKPDESAPVEPEKPESSSKQETDLVNKPTGKLPSTGERIGNAGFIGLALALLVLLLILLRRWTKKEEQ